jgi:hypothetical protein
MEGRLFSINSYILNPVGKKSVDMLDNPRKYFIPIDDRDKIKAIEKDLDFYYIDGAIVIEYYGYAIMDYKYWDLVDQLWMYFILLMDEIHRSNDKAEMYFPDQPVRLGFECIGKNDVLFILDDRKWRLPKKEFFRELVDQAEHFFRRLQEYFPDQNLASYPLKAIKQLKATL